MTTTAHDVLAFWFEETDPKDWFRSDPEFDERLRQRFGADLARAVRGDLAHWRGDARGRLAEVIVLDQFSRNLHRGTPAAFAQDPLALSLAQAAIAAGDLAVLNPTECAFLLLPLMHSESRDVHALAEVLYRDHAPAVNLDFERRHKAIIDRFGRYPHRNAILGRSSTPEEREFLAQPGSGF